MFLDELPYKIKIELATEIHKHMFESVRFFQGKEKTFIAWIGTVLRPMNISEQEYLYKEGEDIMEIYFMVKGAAAYVLPRFDNKAYRIIQTGEIFGHVDIATQEEIDRIDLQQLKKNKRKTIVRRFTVQALDDCETLLLTIDELEKLRLEFSDVF